MSFSLKMKGNTYIMKKRTIVILSMLLSLLAVPGCEKQTDSGKGYLVGKISIGPLCPVQTDPPNPGCLPTAETYKAYPVSIWTSDDKTKISLITPALDGTFRVELGPGSYLLKLDNGQNSATETNLPAEVAVFPQQDTRLDISIDTGIR